MAEWVRKAHRNCDGGGEDCVGVPLPNPPSLQHFSQITQIFPLTNPPTGLFRCNFALMFLSEIVSDRRDVSWIANLPLLLHVSFLGISIYILTASEEARGLEISLINMI